jgi:tetratricopeptide (TPR) repeat protein
LKNLILHTVGIFFIVSLLGGCTTEKNTRASRAYHNVTSQYNVYFNGYESVKQGLENIEKNIEDDYTRILPIYKESNPSAARMVKSDMDNAVIKASKLIELHSITKKPKRRRVRTRKYQEFASKEEFNKWIDDSYVLMARAYFYQHNYVAAINNFSYVVRKYPDEETRYESYVWLIRSYSELERFVEASEVIQAIQNDNKFPKKLEKDLAVATADYYMKQREYEEAIKFLNIAISKTFWKQNKARLKYIVAQLYQETGQVEKAAEAFRAVTRLNPDYKMAFNAMINAAGVFSGKGDTEKLKKELNKMLRDKKNVDFKDQIYYALGNLNLKANERENAKENFRNSVSSSFQNQYQRALSAVTLGDLYFVDLNYENAQAYYDSAMIIIDETYPNYTELSSKYKTLSNLVENLMTVAREDSLQKIALMPDNLRDALINKMIADEQERRRNQENLALQDQRDMGYYRSNRYRMGMGSDQTGAGWYFYNPQTVSYGRVTFQQQWGKRTLEDDWRRSNKTSMLMNEMADMANQADSSQMVIREVDPLKKEFYTQFLPLTDSLMQLSHEKIRDALYNSGKIFKSEYNNYPRSAESFEELNRRYPQNIYLLSAYFDLYDLYELMGDKQKSDYYRDLIIRMFPESNYAQYLINPNYFVEMEARRDTLNRYYQEAYQHYRSGRYRNVIPLAASMKSMEPDSSMLSKIDFMQTVAQGTQSDVHQFERLLKGYIENYPEAEPTTLANEILRLIQDSTLADYQKLVEMGYINEEIQNAELLTDSARMNDEFGGRFTYDEDLLHYFVIAYPRNAKIDLNRLKFDIANYNIDHYTRIDFDIETENLDGNTAFLLVRAIENKENALIYHRAIIRRASVFRALKDVDYFNFVASSTNYRQIMTEKSIADYLKFFVKNYSRFIGSDFSDDESDVSPEDLMARARQEEAALRERGNFVVVNTGTGPGSLFNANIDTTQNFVLAVKEPASSIRQVMGGFAQFNRNEFRVWNLAPQLKSASGYQLLVISGIPSLNEAMSYFRKVVVTRSLFEPLGQASYRNFLVTGENLQKIIDGNKVDEYMDFFRSNYIQRSQEQSPSGSSAAAPVPVQGQVVQPPVAEPVQAGAEKKPVVYAENVDGPHYFVFVVPLEGIDKARFISGISQFNQAGYPTLQLKMEEKPLDNFRQIIAVSGLKDKKQAMEYFSSLVQNRDLYTPLGNANYRNFLISAGNFDIFLKEKNIVEYMDFYKQVYLEQ